MCLTVYIYNRFIKYIYVFLLYLEFSVASRNQLVEEPVSGSTAVTLVVDRRGGLTGVVEVQWRTNSSDVFPLSGSLSFLSSVSQQSFTVNLIADDLPEELEVCTYVHVVWTGYLYCMDRQP